MIIKSRPSIILLHTPPGTYFGEDAYIAIPISGSYNKGLEQYKVKLSSITKNGKPSYALVYNFGIITKKSLRPWIESNLGTNLNLTTEEIEEVANKYLRLVEEGVKMTLKDLQRKPYTEVLMERLERRLVKMEKNNRNLKYSNEELKKGNEDFKNKVENLEKDNKELKEDNKELKEDNKEMKVMLIEVQQMLKTLVAK